MMKVIFVITFLLISQFAISDISQRQLILITKTADELCQSSPVKGSSSQVSGRGDVSAEVKGILKKVVSVGGGLEGIIDEKK